MKEALVVLGLFGLAFAGWYLFKAFVGVVAPLRLSLALLLRSELAAHGVNPASVPPACLDEIAQEAIDVVALFHRQKSLVAQRAEAVQYIERVAIQIARAILVAGDTLPPHLVSTLRNHGVPIKST